MPTTPVLQRKTPGIAEQRQQFDALCIWILAHLNQPLGWQELMAQSGLDHQTLNALFFRFSSSTPMAWIRKQRVLRQAPAESATPRRLSLLSRA